MAILILIAQILIQLLPVLINLLEKYYPPSANPGYVQEGNLVTDAKALQFRLKMFLNSRNIQPPDEIDLTNAWIEIGKKTR